MFYRDILNPKEEYYLHLEIVNRDNWTTSNFYLIYKLNGDIKMKHKIKIISNIMQNRKSFLNYGIKDAIINDDLIIYIGEEIIPENSTSLSCEKILFIDSKNIELKTVICFGSFNSIGDTIYESINQNENYSNSYIDTFKINKKSINEIKEGIEVFKKMAGCKFENIKLNEREKKYVSITIK